MEGLQNVLFLIASVILLLSVDASFLRNLYEKVEKKQHEPEVFEPVLSHKFSRYDTNDDGFVDYEEFVAPLILEFKVLNPPDMRKGFDKADKNGDGRLDEDEFAEFPLHDSPTKGGKEERGCGGSCGLSCSYWVLCSWSCSAGC